MWLESGVDEIVQKIKGAGGQGQIKRVGCIEAVYTVIFGYSCYLIASVFFNALGAIYYRHESMYNNLIFHTVISVFVFFGILLQFLRMYFYLHLFDQKQDDKNHFIAQMSGGHKILDVVCRVAAAATVIVSVKYDPSKLIDYVEGICGCNKIGDVAVLKYFAYAFIFLFFCLMIWDFNLRSWKKKNAANADLNELAKYHPDIKLTQRISGLLFSGFFLYMLYDINKNANIALITFFYAIIMVCFIGAWVYEYIYRYKNYRKLGKPNAAEHVIMTIWHEFFSPVQTMVDLLIYAINSSKTIYPTEEIIQ
ncbi:hypothetical protein [Candidatus Magnetominusculus dajiuhuensis]|uniref:hypothetical protein n=1 Tax=Candidatus Magnetominusculus dajiuhuensis TaxID=3137712 RepID=UPI003B434F6F